MKPPGRTTLARMQIAALREKERIEISQDARVHAGLSKEPMACQVELRDDMAGIVNLIDVIFSDQLLTDRLTQRMKEIAAARVAPPRSGVEDIAVDAEAEAP
jgi:hypothetical protein